MKTYQKTLAYLFPIPFLILFYLPRNLIFQFVGNVQQAAPLPMLAICGFFFGAVAGVFPLLLRLSRERRLRPSLSGIVCVAAMIAFIVLFGCIYHGKYRLESEITPIVLGILLTLSLSTRGKGFWLSFAVLTALALVLNVRMFVVQLNRTTIATGYPYPVWEAKLIEQFIYILFPLLAGIFCTWNIPTAREKSDLLLYILTALFVFTTVLFLAQEWIEANNHPLWQSIRTLRRSAYWISCLLHFFTGCYATLTAKKLFQRKSKEA